MSTRVTTKKNVTISGIGLHSGLQSFVEIFPSNFDSGIVFVKNLVEMEAIPENIVDTELCTVIGKNNEKISTIEHLMAAFNIAGIDDVIVHVCGDELPILDGSAQPWVDLIFDEAGFDIKKERKNIVSVMKPFVVEDGDSRIECFMHNTLKVKVFIDFPFPIGSQTVTFDLFGDSFQDLTRISSARTFGFVSFAEKMRANGKLLGTRMDNCLGFDENGPLTTLRDPNEPVLHKLLDFIGDIRLAGEVRGEFHCHKPNHRLNVEVAKKLVEMNAL